MVLPSAWGDDNRATRTAYIYLEPISPLMVLKCSVPGHSAAPREYPSYRRQSSARIRRRASLQTSHTQLFIALICHLIGTSEVHSSPIHLSSLAHLCRSLLLAIAKQAVHEKVAIHSFRVSHV